MVSPVQSIPKKIPLVHEKKVHDYGDLVKLFEQIFWAEYRTRLVPGGEEPEYLPFDKAVGCARVVFKQDYFASALHEIAHWCVAGRKRRQLQDYGYWYAPDGRSPAQQAEFERMEVKPQALEWLFAEAAGCRFRVSADNLDSALGPSERFKTEIAAQAQYYLITRLPGRAAMFVRGLSRFYEAGELKPQHFHVGRL